MSISFKKKLVATKFNSQWNINKFLLLSGSLIVLVPFFNLLLSSIGFLLDKRAGGIQMASSIFLSVISGVFLFRRFFKKYILATFFSLAMVSSLVFISYLISSRYIDVSYDGQSYHQTAIIELRNGWNPLKKTLDSEELGTLSRWLNHYPKGPWINSVGLYEIFGDIEPAKMLNLIYAFASFLILLSLFLELRISWLYRVSIPLIITFNPVVLYQSMSFYVDGQLYSFLVILCALLWLHHVHKDWVYLMLFFSTVAVLVNIKFTAVVYSIIAISVAILLLLFENDIHRSKRVFLVSISAFFLGIFLVGFNPYVKNTINHGNPFYPLAGEKSISIRNGNIPENYFEMNSFLTFIHSIFVIKIKTAA